MTRTGIKILCALLLSAQFLALVPAAALTQSKENPAEPTANIQAFPHQILKTGVSLTVPAISPNSKQLADNIGLSAILRNIDILRGRTSEYGQNPSPERLEARQDLWDAMQKAELLIQKTNLEIDFTLAEIEAENQLYQEILSTFTNDRDKKVARINALSFISNGILWAAAEAFDIPSFNTTFAKNPKHVVQWSIPSGTTGILAGIIPSIASMYTLKAVNGKKTKSEADPNMLAKLFGYPSNEDIDYPRSVWNYLHQAPASEEKGKTRLNQIVDRWIADANMPDFTDRGSKRQLDVITASVAQRKGLSIGTLTARIVMLQQLHAEIGKMKRLLLELNMALAGEKQF